MLTQTVPVTLYRSTDNGAPQITPTEGAIKTVLEACLVTGYGDKQPLGYEMPFSDATRAVFRSKNDQATRYYVQIDNNHQSQARVTAYQTMSALDNGTGKFPAQPYGIVSEYIPHNRKTHWALIGCDRAFWFITHGDYSQYSQVTFIGDFVSTVPADKHNFAITGSVDTSPYLSSDQNTRLHHNSIAHLALDYNQISPATATLQSAMFHGFDQYPDPISGGVTIAPIFLRELIQEDYRTVRGILPGVFASNVYKMNQATFTILSNFAGTSDSFMLVRSEHWSTFININHFEL